MNENESYLFSVEQPNSWSLKPEQFWITGWFVAKNGVTYTDVRAFIDDVPHTGILGLPRPDIQAAYPQWTRGAFPGFAFRLDPWPGAKLIRLEILNENNDWAEFWRVPIRVRGKGPCKRLQPRLHPELVKPLLLELIKQPSFRPHLTRAGLARRLVQEHSKILLETLPVPPLRGVFENPQVIAHTQYDKLHIRGWVFHDTVPIRRLYATTDGVTQNALVHGLPRDDVPGMFPGNPFAKNPQFKGIIDLSAHAADPICLKIFAELETGELLLAFTKRLYQWTSTEKEHPIPPYHWPTYRNIIEHVRNASRELRVSTGGFTFWKTVFEVHQIFKNESREALPWFAWQKNTPYEAWLSHNQVRPRLVTELTATANRLVKSDGAEIALVVDVRATAPDELQRFVKSVQAQLYSKWRIVFVAPAELGPSTAAAIDALANSEPRVAVHRGGPGEIFSLTMNAAVAAVGSSWLAFPESGAVLSREALVCVAEASASSDIELIYTDEDQIDAGGQRINPVFKCAWSPESVFAGLHPGQLLVVRRELFARTNGFQIEYDRILHFALTLRLQAAVKPSAVRHVPYVCYHGPASRPVLGPGAPEIAQMSNAVSTALQRRHLPGASFIPDFAVQRSLPVQQVYWGNDSLAARHVTIVIPMRDRCELIERCVEALLLTVDWRRVKLLIVDDFSRDEKVLRFLRCLSARTDLSCRVVRPDTDPSAPFSYSRLVNAALPHVDTPLLLHLNNDVDALRPGWIEEMAGWFSIPEVGAVGAKLVYPNNHVNHAGLIVGPHNGLADAPLAGLGAEDMAHWEMHKIARNVSAVTGACMMTRTGLYREFGGFDQNDFSVTYNDVDYCLRLNAAGHRVVYTPNAALWHWGSASRGSAYYEGEHIAFVRKYPGLVDPFWSQKLVMSPPGLTFDYYRYDFTKRAKSLRLLLITHNLNFEGAPLFLLEYAAFMARNEGFSLELISAEDGPLRSMYESLGINITLVDRHPLHGARSAAELQEQVGVMLAKLDLSAVDVVLCNTAACWWGVHLAAAAGKPSMLYIHESATIKRFFSTMLHPHMHGVARAAFRQATRVCFLCHSTRAYYEEMNDYDNFRFVSSWIDLPRIEAFKRAHPKSAMRRKYGYADDEIIIANVGTVCERKGQHTFVRTIDYFMRYFAGGQKYRFLFVGGRPGEYQDSLIRDMAHLGITNVDIITETREAYDFFRLSDMFVCTSFEESLPRVLLEAMGFELPIVSTDVHGVREMVTDKAEAYLVEPGNPVKFAKVMKTCLDKQLNGTSTAAMGYSKVVRAYDIGLILPKHADMARETYLDFDGDTDRKTPHKISGADDRVESSW